MKILIVALVLLTQSAAFPADAKSAKALPAKPVVETTSADTQPNLTPKQVEAGIEKTEANINSSRARREEAKWAANFIVSPFDLLIPKKFGFNAEYFKSPNEVWEFEYVRGKIAAPFFIDDIGAMSDERFSVGKRLFSGNSFNFFYGLTYFRFKTHIGSKLLGSVSGGAPTSVDLLQLESLGFRLGVGNRWSLSKKLTFGIDWIEWNQPVIITKEDESFTDYTTDQRDKDDVETVMKWASYFPRLNILKFQLGWQF